MLGQDLHGRVAGRELDLRGAALLRPGLRPGQHRAADSLPARVLRDGHAPKGERLARVWARRQVAQGCARLQAEWGNSPNAQCCTAGGKCTVSLGSASLSYAKPRATPIQPTTSPFSSATSIVRLLDSGGVQNGTIRDPSGPMSPVSLSDERMKRGASIAKSGLTYHADRSIVCCHPAVQIRANVAQSCWTTVRTATVVPPTIRLSGNPAVTSEESERGSSLIRARWGAEPRRCRPRSPVASPAGRSAANFDRRRDDAEPRGDGCGCINPGAAVGLGRARVAPSAAGRPRLGRAGPRA